MDTMDSRRRNHCLTTPARNSGNARLYDLCINTSDYGLERTQNSSWKPSKPGRRKLPPRNPCRGGTNALPASARNLQEKSPWPETSGIFPYSPSTPGCLAVQKIMRLWSLHPSYLDSAGLVALWQEGLLARKVLSSQTKGYIHHPQLHRFRKLPSSSNAGRLPESRL